MQTTWVLTVAAGRAEDSAGWVVLVLTLAVATATVLRAVGPEEAVVVLRRRRAVRLVVRGVLVAVPGWHRLRRVPTRATLLDPLVVTAVTSDGVPVRALCSARVRLVDPLHFCSASDGTAADHEGLTALVRALEAALGLDLAGRALHELAHYPGPARADAVRAADHSLAPWGAVLTDLGDAVVEVAVDDTLLRWARLDPPAEVAAAEAARD